MRLPVCLIRRLPIDPIGDLHGQVDLIFVPFFHSPKLSAVLTSQERLPVGRIHIIGLWEQLPDYPVDSLGGRLIAAIALHPD